MTHQVVFVALLGFVCVGSLPGCSSGGAEPIWIPDAGLTDGEGGSATGGAGEGGQLPADSTGGTDNPTSGGTGGLATGGATNASGGASGADAGSTGGAGGTGGNPAEGSCTLIPNDSGTQLAEDNPECGIQGTWYTYNDCTTGPADRCTLAQWPELGEFPNENGRMCTYGTTASPVDPQEKELLWGAGIGLPLNQIPETGEKRPIGELPHQLLGFAFTISGGTIPNTLRVTFPTETTVETAHYSELVGATAGEETVRIADAVQAWVPEEQRVSLDLSQVTDVHFEVPTRINESFYFDFCIEELTAFY